MNIRIKATGQTGNHTQLFPNTCFAAGDVDITPEWLEANGCEQVVADAPVYTPEEIAKQQREIAKQARQQAVDSIKVTISNGKVFDGDEISQDRMTRAIVAMQATSTPTVTWVLADNTPTQATVPELIEALALAGAEQASIWVIQI